MDGKHDGMASLLKLEYFPLEGKKGPRNEIWIRPESVAFVHPSFYDDDDGILAVEDDVCWVRVRSTDFKVVGSPESVVNRLHPPHPPASVG